MSKRYYTAYVREETIVTRTRKIVVEAEEGEHSQHIEAKIEKALNGNIEAAPELPGSVVNEPNRVNFKVLAYRT